MGLPSLPSGRYAVSQSPQTNPSDQTVLTVMSVCYVIGGLFLLAVGVLNIWAGVRCLNFRSRTLVLVALFGNILPVFTGYCLPTSLGMLVFGLIVLFNSEVTEAFELGGLREWEDEQYRRRRPRFDEGEGYDDPYRERRRPDRNPEDDRFMV